MSYEIVYDKQFIKLPGDRYVPMLFWGSNNCTSFGPGGRERRARDWSVWAYPCGSNKIWATKEHFIKYCDDYKQKTIDRYQEGNKDEIKNIDSNFGYWSSISFGSAGTRRSTFGMFKGMFTTGCNKALTIEQLKEENITVSITPYLYNDTFEEIGKRRDVITPYTGEQFIEKYEDLQRYYKGTKVSLHISFSGMFERTPKWLRKKYFPKKKKTYQEPVKVNQYWTITVGSRYFVKKLKYGYQYAGYPYLKYKTEVEANKRISKYKDSKYGVKLIKETAMV